MEYGPGSYYVANDAKKKDDGWKKPKNLPLANMSHELRTPLNASIGLAELMVDERIGPLNPEQKEFLRDILSGARHLLGRVDDILDTSKNDVWFSQARPVISRDNSASSVCRSSISGRSNLQISAGRAGSSAFTSNSWALTIGDQTAG